MSPGDSNARKPGKTGSKRKAQLDARAAAKRPTVAQRNAFLELIRDGKPRNIAAAEVGTTGSRFRAMCREGAATYDPAFADAYADACAAGERGLIDKLDELALQRLADPATASDRALHNERIFRDPDYRAAHRQQGASVSVTTEMEVTNVHIAIEGARDRLVQKLAPVLELVPARDAAAGDRGRPN